MVVSEGKGAGAREAVEVAAAVGALDGQPACTYRHDREGTGIGACRRLAGRLATQDSLVRGAGRRRFLDRGVPRHGLPGCGLGHGHGSPVVALCRGKRFPRGLTRPDIRNPGTLCSTSRHIDAPSVGKSPGIGAPETDPSPGSKPPPLPTPDRSPGYGLTEDLWRDGTVAVPSEVPHNGRIVCDAVPGRGAGG